METTDRALENSAPYRPWINREALKWILSVTLITILGAGIRLFFLMNVDFPINDGGLFYRMIQDLIENGYRLPEYTSYNSSQIPFTYPPLSFYLAAVFLKLSGADLLQVVQYMPVFFNILAIPAFFLLCSEICERDQPVFYATLVFAVLPPGYEWLIMGGGVTRSPAYLFSILTLWLFIRALKEKKVRLFIYTGIFAGLTASGHLEILLVTVIWMVVTALLAQDRRWSLMGLIGTGAFSLILTAPWWLTVIARHGIEPFWGALHSGGFNPSASLLTVLLLNITTELIFTPILVFGLFGLIQQIQQRDWLIPFWFAAIAVFNPRNLTRSVFIPLAILAGIAIYDIGIQAVTNFPIRGAKKTRSFANILGMIFIFYLIMRAGITSQLLIFSNVQETRVLKQNDRAAAHWVNQNLPSSSRFLVVTQPEDWWINDVSEWFPALAERRSLTTVQGTEWLPNQQFQKNQQIYEEVQECALVGITCIETKAQEKELDFTHIYLSGKLIDKNVGFRFALPLETELRASSKYTLIYENGDTLIFHRN